MFILIVGGGKVGTYLARGLIKQHHEVVVIEKEARKAQMMTNLLEADVAVVGDGCDPNVLLQAGVARADVVVADTGDDEDNLVVVLISKKHSKARCIARVNNPKNKLIFESLDSEHPVIVISSTEIILDIIDDRVNATALETLARLGKGELELVQAGNSRGIAGEGPPRGRPGAPQRQRDRRRRPGCRRRRNSQRRDRFQRRRRRDRDDQTHRSIGSLRSAGRHPTISIRTPFVVRKHCVWALAAPKAALLRCGPSGVNYIYDDERSYCGACAGRESAAELDACVGRRNAPVCAAGRRSARARRRAPELVRRERAHVGRYDRAGVRERFGVHRHL